MKIGISGESKDWQEGWGGKEWTVGGESARTRKALGV